MREGESVLVKREAPCCASCGKRVDLFHRLLDGLRTNDGFIAEPLCGFCSHWATDLFIGGDRNNRRDQHVREYVRAVLDLMAWKLALPIRPPANIILPRRTRQNASR